MTVVTSGQLRPCGPTPLERGHHIGHQMHVFGTPHQDVDVARLDSSAMYCGGCTPNEHPVQPQRPQADNEITQ